MKSLIQPRTMPGVLELLPREQIAFQHLLDVIRDGYERFGFLPVETPVMELRDVLLTKEGGETERQVYFVQKTGALRQGREPDLALRFDLTVPLARYVAEHEKELTFPFRRYQIQRVYRGEAAQKGRFCEFYQCDIDVIGSGELPLAYDAEAPSIIATIFGRLNFGEFTISINNRKILTGLLTDLGVAESGARQRELLREIDKLDKVGRDRVASVLVGERFGLPAQRVESLLDTLGLSGSNTEMLQALEAMPVANDLFRKGVEELKDVVTRIGDYEIPERRYQINLSIARGLDYYTGTVYETHLDDYPEIGSICSGGRYDDLASSYTSSRLPGVGISIGATRLFDQMRRLGLAHAAVSSVSVLIARLDAKYDGHCTRIAAQLRSVGLNVEQILENWPIKRQLQYANRSGTRLVLMLGEREVAARVVALKDFQTGMQDDLPIDGLAALIAERVRKSEIAP